MCQFSCSNSEYAHTYVLGVCWCIPTTACSMAKFVVTVGRIMPTLQLRAQTVLIHKKYKQQFILEPFDYIRSRQQQNRKRKRKSETKRGNKTRKKKRKHQFETLKHTKHASCVLWTNGYSKFQQGCTILYC